MVLVVNYNESMKGHDFRLKSFFALGVNLGISPQRHKEHQEETKRKTRFYPLSCFFLPYLCAFSVFVVISLL
jgi:hypothetical protein